MTKLLPKDLARAKELMDQAKLDEALEIIEQFEPVESLAREDHLSALLIKGRIYIYKQRTRKALQTYEVAYQMSQDLGLVSESVRALTGKARIGFIGDLNKVNSYVLDAERRLNSLEDEPSTEMLRRDILYIKSWILFFKGNFDGAAESARECLKLSKEERFSSKLDIAAPYLLLGWINLYQGNRTKALDYAMKSLEGNKELNHSVAIADCYNLIARIYFFEGDHDQALQYCKQSLSIKELTKRGRLDVFYTLADLYYNKREIKRSLKYRQQAIVLAEELNAIDLLVSNLFWMGYSYMVIDKNEKAVEYLKISMDRSERRGLLLQLAQSLCFLTVTYIRKNSREIANRYFFRLSDLFDQTKDKGEVDISFWYLFSKAYMMKRSTRMRDRMES